MLQGKHHLLGILKQQQPDFLKNTEAISDFTYERLTVPFKREGRKENEDRIGQHPSYNPSSIRAMERGEEDSM